MHHKTRTREKSFKYAYITFTDMNHKRMVEDAYKEDCVGRCKRKYTMCCSSDRESREKYEKKHFFKKWPSPKINIDNPEFIKWENIGFSKR